MRGFIRRHGKILSEMIFLIISLSMGIWIAIQFFNDHFLFNSLTIVFDDFAFHVYRVETLVNLLFPEFHSVFGFSNLFYAGYPTINMYPVGMYLVMAVLEILGINPQISIRIFLFGAIVVVAILPYIVARIFRIPPYIAWIGVVWFIFGAGNSEWLNFLSYGMIPYSLALIFSGIFLSRIQKIDFSQPIHVFPLLIGKENAHILIKKHFLRDSVNVILIVLIILSDFAAFIFIGFFLIIYLISFIGQRHFKTYFKNFIWYFLKIGIYSGGILAFWLLPTIFIQFPNTGNLQNNLIFSESFGKLITTDLISRYNYATVGFLIALGIYVLLRVFNKKIPELKVESSNNNYRDYFKNHYKNENKNENEDENKDENKNESKDEYRENQDRLLKYQDIFKGYRDNHSDRTKKINYLILLIFSALALVIFSPYLNVEFLSGINSYRFFVFFEIFLPILFLLIVVQLFNFLRIIILTHKSRNIITRSLKPKNIGTKNIGTKKFSTKYARSKNIKQFLAVIGIFGILISSISASSVFLFYNATPYANKENRTQWALQGPQTPFYMNNYTKFATGVPEIINWIKQNTTTSSRILFENSGEEGALRLGGHLMGLIALWTNRTYIGGYLSHFWYINAQSSSFHDGILFGMNITLMPHNEFLEKCRDFNINYIIVWTDQSKAYFSKWVNETQSPIEFNESFGGFSIYKLVNPSDSWVFSDTCNPITQNLQVQQNEVTFTVSNASKDDVIYYSLHDFTNWHVYINGKPVEKIKNNLDFIAFKIPNADLNSSYNVEIIWKRSFLENISYVITFFSIFVFISGFFSRFQILVVKINQKLNSYLFRNGPKSTKIKRNRKRIR